MLLVPRQRPFPFTEREDVDDDGEDEEVRAYPVEIGVGAQEALEDAGALEGLDEEERK